MMTEADMQDAQVIIGIAWKACAENDPTALGRIVATVYAYKKFNDDPSVLREKLSDIIAKSHEALK